MSEYLAFASALSTHIAQFGAATGVRAQPSAAFAGCGCAQNHFVPAQTLERHLRTVHGIKHLPHETHQFFYSNAPGVERISRGDASGDQQCADISVPDVSKAGAQTRSEDAVLEEDDDNGDDASAADSEPLAQSLLEPLPSSTIAAADTAEAESVSSDPSSSSLATPEGLTGANGIRGRVVAAISAMANDDAGEFYAQVQRWRHIPHAFEVLAWSESDESADAASSAASAVVPRKSVQGWLIAELSRTVFKDEPLDMDLVDYVAGLLEHPEFCQPDLLVLELHEFLGGDVARFVLALWKFLVVEIAMRLVFNTTKESLAKQIRSREVQESAARAERMLQQLRETEQAQLKRESDLKSKNGPSREGAGEDSASRDYKRRRPTYRKKGSGSKSAQLVLREVLEKQMLTLSMQTGWDLVVPDETSEESKEQSDTSSQRNGSRQEASRTAAADWMLQTDALRVRDMARSQAGQQQPQREAQEMNPGAGKRDRGRSRSLSVNQKRQRSSRHSERARRSSSRSRSHSRRRHHREDERSSRSRRSRSRSASRRHGRDESQDSRYSSRSRRR